MAPKMGAFGKSLLVLSCLIGSLSAGATCAWSQNPRNEIEVRVTLPDGHPADEMPVFLLDDGYTEIVMHYTDAGGRCFFRGLSQGTFYVQLEPKGRDFLRPNPFRVQIGDVATSGGEKYLFEMRLLPKDPGSSPAGNAASVFHQLVPDDARQIYTLACESLGRDDFATAEKELRQALEIFPDYFDALDRLGSTYVQRKMFDQAIPPLRHALEVNKSGWHSQYSLGVAQLELDQRVEGIASLRKAAELNPLSPNINMRLGIELAKDPGTYDEAIRALVRVSRLAGKDLPDAYFFLASLYTKKNRFAEAADALESYLGAMPKASDEQKAQYRKAINQLRAKASQSRKKP